MPLRTLYEKNRLIVLERDGNECTDCGMDGQAHIEKYGRSLNVHHIIPYPYYREENPDQHDIENLKTVCTPCHKRIHATDLKPTEYDTKKLGKL